MFKKLVGCYGEYLAKQIYQNLGHQIVATNLRTPFGEVDLITTDKNFIYITEVKVSSNSNFGLAIERWQRSQKSRLIKAIHYLIAYQIITEPELIKVNFIVFDLSAKPKVRLRRFPNVPINL